MAFRDRIKELRRVRIGDCEPHPLNYRTHPVEQGAAVTGLLQEVGIIDVALAFPADGLGPAGDSSRLMLYDGHLRQRLGPDQVWPVAVTDLTRAEADIVIATLHPTAEMAETDEDMQRQLLGGLEAEEAELRKLIDEMLARLEREAAEERTGDEDATEGPDAMYLRPHEHYDYVIVLASNTNEWNILMDLLDLKTVRRSTRKPKFGIGRGVKASTLIELIQGLINERVTEDRGPVASQGQEHAADALAVA